MSALVAAPQHTRKSQRARGGGRVTAAQDAAGGSRGAGAGASKQGVSAHRPNTRQPPARTDAKAPDAEPQHARKSLRTDGNSSAGTSAPPSASRKDVQPSTQDEHTVRMVMGREGQGTGAVTGVTWQAAMGGTDARAAATAGDSGGAAAHTSAELSTGVLGYLQGRECEEDDERAAALDHRGTGGGGSRGGADAPHRDDYLSGQGDDYHYGERGGVWEESDEEGGETEWEEEEREEYDEESRERPVPWRDKG